MKLQDTVKKETVFVAAGTAVGTVLMIIVFLILHKVMPKSVPFDYKVILGGIGGAVVASVNFFLMAVMVQKVAAEENEDNARRHVTVSFRYRTMMQLVWSILAIVLPVFNGAAGIIPLFIPSYLIKLRGIFGGNKAEA